MSYTKSSSIGSIYFEKSVDGFPEEFTKEIKFSDIHSTEQSYLLWAKWVETQLMDSETGSKIEIDVHEWRGKLLTILTDQELSAEEDLDDDAPASTGMELVDE